jgi:Mlc titration factor MtfA (ptsG expression regulator)
MFSVVVVSGVLVVVILWFKKDLKKSYAYAGSMAAPVKSFVLPVPQQYRDILQKYFKYYQQLTPQNKARFEQKVCNFIYGKRFIPRNVDEVTIEAKILIAASAVQLTFGLADVYLRHFTKILVYPDNYYSSITRRYHKGEVNPRFGLIVLSWQAFVDGYIYPNDSINLGLHEMAHALRLENMIRDEDYRFFDQVYLDKLDEWSHKICSDSTHTFFRPYACVNVHEFFSVAVENFFERTDQFKKELPELYNVMTALLRQDPLRLIQPHKN